MFHFYTPIFLYCRFSYVYILLRVTQPNKLIYKEDRYVAGEHRGDWIDPDDGFDESDAIEAARELLATSLGKLPNDGALGVYFSAQLCAPFGNFTNVLQERYDEYRSLNLFYLCM